MDRSPEARGRRLPTVPSATVYQAYDIHWEMIAATRLLRTVWPGIATADFVPSYRPDTGRVNFVALHDDQGCELLDGRGLSRLCDLEARRVPGRAGDDRAVAAEGVFRVQAAVGRWRKAKLLHAPAGATWEIREGEARDATGDWAPPRVRLALPAEAEAQLAPVLSATTVIAINS